MAPQIRAALFDMDGTLVHNMPHHFRAWQVMAAKLGTTMPIERFEREFAGKKNEEIFPALLGRELEPAQLQKWAEEKESLYREIYTPDLSLMPGTLELMDALKANGVKLAVATAAPELNRKLVLDGLKLRDRFDAIVGPEGVARGKPAPDIFLKVAAAVGVAPAECVVFEDAVNGIKAAVAAGMLPVAILTNAPEEALRGAGAQFAANDFLQLAPELRARLGLR